MINVLLVGCGRIGKRHCQILSGQSEKAKLVGVVDYYGPRARDYGSRFDVPHLVADTTKRQDRPKISDFAQKCKGDLITLGIATGNHFYSINNLMPLGIPMLVEKPLVLSLREIGILEHNAKVYGSWICEVKQNRYNVAVQTIRDNIYKLGKIRLVHCSVLWSRTPAYYADWHGQWLDAGGVLANQAIHHIDLLWWLLGDIRTVSATATYSNYTEVETGIVATLGFDSGCIGTLQATTLATRDLEGAITLIGENGTVKIGGFACNQIDFWEPDQNWGDKKENPPDVYGYGHQAMYDDIDLAQPPPVPIWQAAKALEICHAIYHSSKMESRVILGQSHYKHSRLGKG